MNTIVARLTPAVPAAIATLAISGPLALSCVERFVRLSGAELAVGSLRFGVWEVASVGQGPVRNPTAERRATLSIAEPAAERRATFNTAGEPTTERRATLEQVVLTRPKADTVEVHCHGGAAVCQALLSDLVSAGCVMVAAEQWPSRLSCPLARAAEEDLLNATTDRAAAVLLDQFSGALHQAIENVARRSASDEPGNISLASAGLEQLLQWADFGLHLSQPWRIVLAGPPNVGKSSLLNALAGTRQAIVHHQPGTTRDWIEWSSAIDGWPVVFTDTAGVRAASEPIERAGVERSLNRLIEADLALLVVDAQQGWTDEHARLLELAPARRMIVCNKADLMGAEAPDLVVRALNSSRAEQQTFGGIVATSATDGTGIDHLQDAMARILVPETPDAGTAVPFRIGHIESLKRCRELLQQGDTEGAIARLRSLLM
ncbi:MAG: 50S ribosome-binding GTPase [Pirellulaceae bacterium]|nr:50S ribosome-binding GTPase [Pirellulaceae bacterium]